MSAATQRERVLHLLQRKPDGVSPYDFTPPTADGGKPIMRVAARILELREDGLEIETRTSPNGSALYVLAGVEPAEPEPAAPQADDPVSAAQQTNLFDLLHDAA